MYDFLGFRAENEAGEKAREAAKKACSEQTPGSMEIDTTGTAIVVDDYLPGEMTVVHDQNRPSMALGTVYPNQQEFRLAVRQFAINEEFELHTVKLTKLGAFTIAKQKVVLGILLGVHRLVDTP